jgi:hypothetical protein
MDYRIRALALKNRGLLYSDVLYPYPLPSSSLYPYLPTYPYASSLIANPYAGYPYVGYPYVGYPYVGYPYVGYPYLS